MTTNPQSSGASAAVTLEISDHLPLALLRSQLIPPAPNRRKSAIDFLHDFGGASWIAYGASSLLVFCQFPSPLSNRETLVGPFFHQVIEPDPPCSSIDLNAVSWCPTVPSDGEVAAAIGNRISLYSPRSGTASGSFSWRQTAGIVQSFPVHAIKWTGSGDGLIAASIDVVLWIRRNTSWEIAWKSKAAVPQTLVSATWFAEGSVATAAKFSVQSSEETSENSASLSRKESLHAWVYHNDPKSGVRKIQLCHPQPVTMIQWRPSSVKRLKKDTLGMWRDVLLTCCLDGTVRLWSEINNGRARKSSKDIHDPKNTTPSFHVVAIIEINQCMKGTLGVDLFIEWVIELGCAVSKFDGDNYCLSSAAYGHEQIGNCEWLVSVGPRYSVAFWAIHCLDDMSPLRFPRVTLWQKQDLVELRSCNIGNSNFVNSEHFSILLKVVASRSQQFGPPVACSFLQLLPDNSVSWSHLYSPKSNHAEDRCLTQTIEGKNLSCFASSILNQDGHTGCILQISVHPYSSQIELAVSLDSNGLLLFWSLPTISNFTLGMQMLNHHTWELLGKVMLQDLSTDIEYSTLTWAPSVLDENRFLLLGYADGIDCFLVKVSGEGKRILCHKILTIPFAGLNCGTGPPSQIFVIPLASSCKQSFLSNSFLLFAVWMERFQASSWKVILHSEDLCEHNCGRASDGDTVDISESVRYLSSLEGQMFYATINLGSSIFPDLQSFDIVTSIAVVSPANSVLSKRQCFPSYNGACGRYHMATGCSDGTVKLWKMSYAESTDTDLNFLPWQLVGMFTAHDGPVTAVSLSIYGGKIASVATNGSSSTSLHIWEPVCLINGGSFLLEDAISLNGTIVALSWLAIGNGHFLLAVCMENELRIYSEKRFDQFLIEAGKSEDMHVWCCVALSHTYPVPRGFVWGPKVTPVVVHEKYFSLFSQWLLIAEHGSIGDCSASFVGRADENVSCAIFTEIDTCHTRESSGNEKNMYNGQNICTFCLNMFQQQSESDIGSRMHSLLEIADRLCGSLAVYHPVALLQNLYSGNWKRTYAVLKHLSGAVKSKEASATGLDSDKTGNFCYNSAEIHLSRYFEDIAASKPCNKGLLWGLDTASGSSTVQFQRNIFQLVGDSSQANASESSAAATSQKSEILGFIDTLDKSNGSSAFTNIEKTQILAILDLLCELSESSCSSAYESLDKPGRRFWVAVRFQHLYFLRKFGSSAAGEFVVESKLLAWAFQSDCQDSLLSSLLPAEPSWLEYRKLGVGFWFTNASELRTRMERLARVQYLKKKDPKDCALLYLALNRLQVLAGLFKITKDEKDKVLVGFLSRNFQEERNKAAALKNAYVLMGRHQLELAIAFFLLGGDPASAVTACAKNLRDEQLALVICRLTEGYGGPLEKQLISNVLLPNAIEKEDYWLSSLLEWALGNYSGSIKKLFDFRIGSVSNYSSKSNHMAFLDPDIGQYCVMLATTNCLKNSIGDYLAMVLSKMAILMAVNALDMCGFPLEALECFSSSFRVEDDDRGNLFDVGNHEIFHRLLSPFPSNGANWLLSGIAHHLELNARLNLAMQYISTLLRLHPSWPRSGLPSFGKTVIHEKYDSRQDGLQIGECIHNLNMVMSMFEHKYSLKSVDLANMMLVFACNNGLLFYGHRLLQGSISQEHETDGLSVGQSILSPPRLLLKASKELFYLFAQYVVSCSLNDSALEVLNRRSFTIQKANYDQAHCRDFCLQSVIYSLRTIRSFLNLDDYNVHAECLTLKVYPVFDLLEYFIHLASNWFNRNLERLIVMIHIILDASVSDLSSFEVIVGELMKLLHQTSEWTVHGESSDGVGVNLDANVNQRQLKQRESSVPSISEDEGWQLAGASLWMHISAFVKHHLSKYQGTERTENESTVMDLMDQLSVLVSSLSITSMEYVSSSLTKQLASFLRHKASQGLPVSTFAWLEESCQHQSRPLHHNLNQGPGSLQLTTSEDGELLFHKLLEIPVSPKEICESFVNERVICFHYNSQRFPNSWKDIQKGMLAEYEDGFSLNSKAEDVIGSGTSNGTQSLSSNRLDTDVLLETRRKSSTFQSETNYFYNPQEVLKRSGELLEAICFNSVNEQQLAVSSNRKGLLFFNWKTEQHIGEQAEYIWPQSDWPQNGWAGCESTPIPTYVSEGIGLGTKSGAHLGLGGATTGLRSLARPGKDLTGGGAFGIPGYAGIGAAGLGWGQQEDFEDFVDPPATVANISSRALSRHPSRPILLVGSSNTHIYLWEFGKDKATATYGVLPAANVPPPYALASISAVQFDHCGHRFATAALDGTVCTWQLEVGGRSNVHPTESSVCFNNHASDVAYVAASGSILAAAGSNSNGVNIVVWDTLAPPVTSQASIVCHEGGARALSVFDNDIGSGSISPIIVTGGKSGDVAVHDFRFIATGRTKRHRSSSQQDLKDPHENGMLWYIPKAHLGNVTKISTIPSTSLFLTGSKDGDVKLWDAKRSKLVYHWQKMHDRHTFLQPNSRTIGGVVRAAVTDIQVFSHGFLTCGGDGSVKLVQLK